MRLTGKVWVAESVSESVAPWLAARSACRTHLAVQSIATGLGELQLLFRPGTVTGARAHCPRRSESLNLVGLQERPKASVAPTGPGRREVHLMTGVAQWWG